MIVHESDMLLAALDRRLQIDRITSLDPLTTIGRAPDQSRTPQPGVPAPAGLPGGSAASVARPPTATSPVAARLPLGSVINARVTTVPQPDHVVAEVGSLRIELAWPAANGAAPRLGSEVTLRVLAHTPMLLFQRLGVADASTAQTGRAEQEAPHWSSDAIRLQTPTAANESGAQANGSGPVRFDTPILEIAIGPRDPRTGPEPPLSDGPVPEEVESRATQTFPRSQSHPQSALQAQPQTHSPSSPDLSRMAAAPTLDPSTPIALDDIVVARHTAFVDGIATPVVPRNADETKSATVPFSPLVLQGPAWPGQSVELVVRREREDEQFDNPVLDHWCGEVLIDLPNLGRIAAHLSLSMKGLKLRIEGDDSASVDAMTGAAPALASALGSAEMRVATLTIAQPAADALRHSGGPETPASVAFRLSSHG